MASSEEVLDWIRAKGVTPLFLMVSGSHANSMARPDSDLDIRGIYADPVDKMLSLHNPKNDTIEAVGILDGDTDVQLFEVRKALNMFLNKNGNICHQVLAPTTFYDSGDFDWKGIGQRFLTKRLSTYFAGYYTSQKKRAAQNRGGKSLLYCYRELLSGIMLMRTGQWIFNFWDLKREFEQTYNWHSHLLDAFINREDWKRPVAMDRLNDFAIEWEKLVALLNEETEKSPLPDRYDGRDYLNNLLLDYRYKQLASSFIGY
jgi:predicted nucleotidyltransferase